MRSVHLLCYLSRVALSAAAGRGTHCREGGHQQPFTPHQFAYPTCASVPGMGAKR